jgi:hypothetical protein
VHVDYDGVSTSPLRVGPEALLSLEVSPLKSKASLLYNWFLQK